jgi:hypothetical protein
MLLSEKQVKELIAETVQKEMAIANYKTVGDFNRRSSISSKVDRDLVTHPKGIEKIKRQWQKTPWDFDIYVVNDPRVNKPQFREVGVVSPDFVYSQMKLTPEEIPLNSNHISIIFTNNVAADKIPLTGWTMAHRLGHAFAASNRGSSNSVGRAWNDFNNRLRYIIDEIMNRVYNINTKNGYGWNDNNNREKMLKYVAQELGTMKAARDKKIRSWFEFGYELLAQYMITGKITLNPLPRQMVVGIAGWGRKEKRTGSPDDMESYNTGLLDQYAEELQEMLDDVLSQAVGEVLVM